MTTEYVAVQQQIWGYEKPDGTFTHGTDFTAIGPPAADRRTCHAEAVAELGHDDFNIATLHDGRLVAFGYEDTDFGPDEDGAPHGGYDLAEIAQAIGVDHVEVPA